MRKTLIAAIAAFALIFTPVAFAGQLTNDMAKNAISTFIYNYHGCTSLEVVGVLEVQQNVARVDFKVKFMLIPATYREGLVPFDGPAAAAFVRYNDNKWHLKEVHVARYTWRDLDIIAK